MGAVAKLKAMYGAPVTEGQQHAQEALSADVAAASSGDQMALTRIGSMLEQTAAMAMPRYAELYERIVSVIEGQGFTRTGNLQADFMRAYQTAAAQADAEKSGPERRLKPRVVANAVINSRRSLDNHLSAAMFGRNFE
jgi:hypothetical protein